MEKIFIFGHRKPDTDSVCGAISLTYLKKQMGLNAEPRILSEIGAETQFALNYFKVPVPKYLNDVKVQLKDVKYKKDYYLNENTSIYSTYNYMTEKGITGIPLVDDKKHFVGYVSLKEIANKLIVNDSNNINTTFDSICDTLNSSKFYKFDDVIEGNVMAVSLPYLLFMDTVALNEKSILIVGNREHIINYGLESKVKLLIIINDHNLTKEQLELAKKNKVNVIITPYDTFKTSRIINLSNPIKSIKRSSSAVCFDPNDYLTDFLDVSNKLKHTNYPIVNGKGICEGMLRVIDTNEITKKQVILVDHNEPRQSVDGLNEAELLEIVDHHNIGDINTTNPINFRNMSVGSVNTIIYTLYEEQSIEIPQDIAGIMLSGIISDTLLFASPTTTELDKKVAQKLATIANVDLQKYGVELLGSGVSIEGMSITDVIYKDFKNYTINENKFGIGQVFTTDFKVFEKDLDNYISTLNDIAQNNNYKIVCLFVTDIITNDSYILYNEKAHSYLLDAFNLSELKEGTLLKGMVSRKKQMVPPIMEILEKL
jgi:manganese-dependent inorganic pyrophosphatase